MNLRRRYPARAYEYELLGPGHVEAEGIRVDHGPALVVVIVFAPAADPDVGVRQRRRAVDVERRGRGRMVHDALRRGKITVPDDYVALLEAHEALVVARVDVVDLCANQNFTARSLNQRVVLHTIDVTPA